MKFKSILLVALALCLTICLCACGDDGSVDSGSTKDTTAANKDNSTTTTTQNIPTPTTTTTVDSSKTHYTVTVVDEAGNPVEGARLQLCKDSCVPCIAPVNGVSSWDLPEDDYEIKFLMIPAGYAADQEVYLFEDGSTDLTIVLKAVA